LKLGAHSIGVEKGAAYGKTGWVVVAHVTPGTKVDLPASLPLTKKDDGASVPVVTKQTQRFVPE
jgi:hypothetical protein